MKDVEKELEQDEGQDKIDVTKNKIMRVMIKMPNWKAPGPENIQGYWSKSLTPLHDKLLVYLQDFLDSGVVPDWLTKVDQGGYCKQLSTYYMLTLSMEVVNRYIRK